MSVSIMLWVHRRRGRAPRWFKLYDTGGGVFTSFQKHCAARLTARLFPVGYLAAGLCFVQFMISLGACRYWGLLSHLEAKENESLSSFRLMTPKIQNITGRMKHHHPLISHEVNTTPSLRRP